MTRGRDTDMQAHPPQASARRTWPALRRLARPGAATLPTTTSVVALQADDGDRPWLDTSLGFEERAAALVSRMTLEEKAAQMQNDSPAIERLGVPEYEWWNEALHGVARAGAATVFPQAIGMAATFDVPLLHQTAIACSAPARATQHESLRNGWPGRYQGLTIRSRTINICRDPRWGRGQESYGEDQFLPARKGVSFGRGLQGMDPRTGEPL